MSVADNTPVLIGVGEASERIGAPDYAAASPAALAGQAAASSRFPAPTPGRRSARRTTSPAPSAAASAPIRPARCWKSSAGRGRSTW